MVREWSMAKSSENTLTPHFKVKEFACKDGSDKVLIEEKIPYMLEDTRKIVNAPIHIVSGYRTEMYNEFVGGAKSSYHIQGRAVDCFAKGVPNEVLAIALAIAGFKGIIIYKEWVHADDRGEAYINVKGQ